MVNYVVEQICKNRCFSDNKQVQTLHSLMLRSMKLPNPMLHQFSPTAQFGTTAVDALSPEQVTSIHSRSSISRLSSCPLLPLWRREANDMALKRIWTSAVRCWSRFVWIYLAIRIYEKNLSKSYDASYLKIAFLL